jgi:hypothetical protein
MRSWIALILSAIVGTTAQAQGSWSLALETSRATYTPAAYDTSTPRISIGAWGPMLFTARLSRSGAPHGFGLAVSYMNAPLGGEVEEVALFIRRSLQMVEIAPEWRFLLVEAPTGARLVASAGPIADGWGPSAEPIRWRIGAMAGATLEFPLSDRWRVGIRGDFAITGSYLNPEDDDEEIDLEPTMRRTRIGLGITRRL